VTIDSVIQQYRLKPRWIKIDVEGAEYEVLEGCKNTLKSCSPKLIIEVQKNNLNKVIDFMNNFGYNYDTVFTGDTYIELIFYK